MLFAFTLLAGIAPLARPRRDADGTLAASAPTRLDVLAPAVPLSLDPYADPTVSARAVFLSVYEPLVRTDGDGRLVPALARAWEEPAPIRRETAAGTFVGTGPYRAEVRGPESIRLARCGWRWT